MADIDVQLVHRCLSVVNSDRQPHLRDLRLVCSDGTLTWNALFLNPVLSGDLKWECEMALGKEDQGALFLLLPEFSMSYARALLEVVTSGEASVSSEGDRREVLLLLRALGADLKMFSGLENFETSSESSEGNEGKGKCCDREKEVEHWEEVDLSTEEEGMEQQVKPSRRSLPCPFCDFASPNPYGLVQHLSYTHFREKLLEQLKERGVQVDSRDPDSFRCPECEQVIGGQKDCLVRHWGATHRRALDFLRGDDLKFFPPVKRFAPHVPIRETCCPLCEKYFSDTFATAASLKTHLSKAHFGAKIGRALEERARREGKRWLCPECGLKAPKGELVAHYGSRHSKVLDFVDERLRRWLERLGVRPE